MAIFRDTLNFLSWRWSESVVLPLPNEAMLHSIWHSNLTSFFRCAKYINNGLFWLYLELFLPFHHGDGQSRWCYRCQMRRCCRARRSPCCHLTSRCPRILWNLCIVVIKVIAYKSRSAVIYFYETEFDILAGFGPVWQFMKFWVTVSLDY